jgi:hypothetical protein
MGQLAKPEGSEQRDHRDRFTRGDEPAVGGAHAGYWWARAAFAVVSGDMISLVGGELVEGSPKR